MKRFNNKLSYALYILLVAGFLNCTSQKELTYKRLDYNADFKDTGLCGQAMVITKQNGMILLKDQTGWIEQTFYNPFVSKHEVGDTVHIKPCN